MTHQDIGQMQMYVNYYTRQMINEGDNPPIGIVLCADKSDTLVEYTLPEDNRQIFAAKYLPYIPTKEELKRELNLTVRSIDQERVMGTIKREKSVADFFTGAGTGIVVACLFSPDSSIRTGAIVVGIVMVCIGWYKKSKSDKKVFEYIQEQD